ncbi:hypothetical protein [Psychrobacillus phage Perkons]|nr:hypothetical protein [Psychrobacillus phage Perkons]
MQVIIDKSVKRGIKVNDVFKVEDNFYMLVKIGNGYALPSLSLDIYLGEENLVLKTLDEVESFIVKVEEFHGLEHYSNNNYYFQLHINSK